MFRPRLFEEGKAGNESPSKNNFFFFSFLSSAGSLSTTTARGWRLRNVLQRSNKTFSCTEEGSECGIEEHANGQCRAHNVE
jgi:hypothetical protein